MPASANYIINRSDDLGDSSKSFCLFVCFTSRTKYGLNIIIN